MFKSLLKNIPIDNENYLVVGVSSGPDSMALLHYLKNNTTKKIIVAHINHNIRKESNEEEKYLETYCNENNIIFESMKIEKYKENNFENEARKIRYSFYEKILKKYNCHHLFLAHHGDDLIETVLMKIIRGSNIEGFAGIKKISKMKDYYIIRPFIEYTKKDLIEYDKKHNLHYFIDKTNEDTTYTRNRIRKNILPLLKEEDKNIHKKFYKYSNILLEYDNYLNYETDNFINKYYKDSRINITHIKNKHQLLQKNIIYNILLNIYQNKTNIIKEKHIKNILDIINNTKPNISIDLPQNIVVTKEYNNLFFHKKDNKTKPYKIKLKNKTTINNHTFKIIKNTTKDGNNICRLNSKDIKLPLYLRNKEEGDNIEVLGLNGKKKVKDIFIEVKMPLSKRKNYPILVDDNNQILWIPNIKKSKFNLKKDENYDIIIEYCEEEENNE